MKKTSLLTIIILLTLNLASCHHFNHLPLHNLQARENERLTLKESSSPPSWFGSINKRMEVGVSTLWKIVPTILVGFSAFSMLESPGVMGGEGPYFLKTWSEGNNNVYGRSIIEVKGTEDLDVGGYYEGYSSFINRFGPDGSLTLGNSYGGPDDSIYSMVQTLEGNFILAGTGSAAGASILLSEVSMNGSLYWAKYIGNIGNNRAQGYSVTEASNKDLLVTGQSKSDDLLWGRLDKDGIPIRGVKWITNPAKSKGWSIIETANNDSVVTGYTEAGFGGSIDVVVVRLDPNGAYIWDVTLGGLGKEEGNAIIEMSDLSLVGVGYTESFGSSKVLVYKLASNGTLVWAKAVFGGGDCEAGFAVIEDRSSSDIILSGSYEGKPVVVRLTPEGELVWAKSSNTNNTCDCSTDCAGKAYAMVQTSKGDLATTGGTYNDVTGNFDGFVHKMSNDNNTHGCATLVYPMLVDITHNLSVLASSTTSMGTSTLYENNYVFPITNSTLTEMMLCFPSMSPTSYPSTAPTLGPNLPSMLPSLLPTSSPSLQPSKFFIIAPTLAPSLLPMQSPNLPPTKFPTTAPTLAPILLPTKSPSILPSLNSSVQPTKSPTLNPGFLPSEFLSISPTFFPVFPSTQDPSLSPSVSPSIFRSSSSKESFSPLIIIGLVVGGVFVFLTGCNSYCYYTFIKGENLKNRIYNAQQTPEVLGSISCEEHQEIDIDRMIVNFRLQSVLELQGIKLDDILIDNSEDRKDEFVTSKKEEAIQCTYMQDDNSVENLEEQILAIIENNYSNNTKLPNTPPQSGYNIPLSPSNNSWNLQAEVFPLPSNHLELPLTNSRPSSVNDRLFRKSFDYPPNDISRIQPSLTQGAIDSEKSSSIASEDILEKSTSSEMDE